ncbi:MAG: hypothetical protein V3V08_05455 [Nannocystaceae bacterium]
MAKSILEELVTVLGYEIDDDDLKKFNKQVDAAKASMKTFALVATASAAAVGVFIDSVANATTTTARFADRVGASFDEVQRLVHATELWGGSVADVESTLQSLNRLASTAARGAGGGEIFGFLGISPTQDGRIKDSIQLLKEVADATSKIESPARRADLLSQVGVSERMILLLAQGSKGIEKLGAELDEFGFVLTEEQADNAEAYFTAVVKAKAAVKGLGNEIGLRLAPRLTEAVNGFLEWVKANKALVDSDLDTWIQNLEKLAGPAKIIGGVLAAMFIAANAANLAIAALVVTFGLLVDDILAFRKGDPSLVGKGLEKADQFVKSSSALNAIFRGFGNKLGQLDELLFNNLLLKTGSFLLGQSGFGTQAPAAGGTTNTDVQIRIDGSKDPRATGIAVVESLQEFFRGEFSGVTVAPRT